MASCVSITQIIFLIVLFTSLFLYSFAKPIQTQQSLLFQYHNGHLLTGNISIDIIWYGKFASYQRAIITDFILSLSSSTPTKAQPNVATWWNITEKYYNLVDPKISKIVPSLGNQIMDPNCSIGKHLNINQIERLASKGSQKHAINVVLTSTDVAVQGFCSKCGTHGYLESELVNKRKHRYKFAYIWVGNAETQCPSNCSWPFNLTIYGPKSPPLVAPNNDVGVDGMVMNLASLLVGTATNPFGNGYYQGPKEEPLEAVSACPGMYGTGTSFGFPGKLLVDVKTGASYNTNGVNGRKYLLPPLYDPSTKTC
ncbi:hypothetical protein ACJW30_10G148500 [Castanea mollissima]